MVSSALSSLVCVLCLILLPAVWAEYCSSYWDSNGYHHETQQCNYEYCCGICTKRYCCSDRGFYLPPDQQARCPSRPSSNDKRSRLATLLGSILGSIFPILLCVGLVICCVAPCCLFYKKCRKGRNQRPHTVMTTVVQPPQPHQPHQPHPPHQPHQPHPPHQPQPSSGYQPSYPGYQPVPTQPGYGVPAAPPPYTDGAHYPAAYPAGMPMLPFSGQPYAPPPHSDEIAPLPYNPSYAPNP